MSRDGDPEDPAVVLDTNSDSSSEDPSVPYSDAPWSNQAGTTDPSSLSLSNEAAVKMVNIAEHQLPMTYYTYAKSAIGKNLVEEDDDIQSIASVPDDIASLAESTSDLEVYRQPAANYLIKKFTDDSELVSLYQDLTKRMGEARFVRNHTRLLKIYFLDLQSDEHTPSQKLAVKFLRLRSERTRISSKLQRLVTASSNDIREQINTVLDQGREKLFLLDRLLAKNDEDPDDYESDDGMLAKLDATAEFLTSGSPFNLYKENLRVLLHSGAKQPFNIKNGSWTRYLAQCLSKIRKFARPQIKPGFRRIEWKCVRVFVLLTC